MNMKNSCDFGACDEFRIVFLKIMRSISNDNCHWMIIVFWRKPFENWTISMDKEQRYKIVGKILTKLNFWDVFIIQQDWIIIGIVE